MKNIFSKYIRTCPKTGKVRGIQPFQKFSRFLWPILGLAALIWILIRVIPKPSRLQYPCMKVAAPIASSFLIYISGLLATVFSFRKAREYFSKSRYSATLILLIIGITVSLFTVLKTNNESYAIINSTDSLFVPSDPPNSPVGTATGIFPGRVVWMWDSSATSWDGNNGYWWSDENTNQEVVDSMLSKSLHALIGKTTNVEAWDTLFKYFNYKHGKGVVGYRSGEKIAIKINLNQISGIYNPGNASFPSPHVILALVRQLVYYAGVAAEDITFYDSNRFTPDAIFNKCKNEFPDVHFMGWEERTGREKYVRDTTTVKWSEDLTLEIGGGHPAYLPTVVTHAEYLINLANFKGHRYAGVTFCSKNHFGTFSCDDNSGNPYLYAPHAAGVHPYMAVHDIIIEGSPEWTFYGRPLKTYNVLVDLMGHKDIGGKTLLFMIDGLYGVESEQASVSNNSRWLSSPFNNDWTSSLFLSQDNVAIESVGLDFYRTEQSLNPNYISVYGAVDNYLHEAAQADSSPSGTVYDPEGDGVPLKSLGVHEHWNNSTDKEYSRNLDAAGTGIELVCLRNNVTSVDDPKHSFIYTLYQNYPNPFNPTTNIGFHIAESGFVTLKVYDIVGREVVTLVDEFKQVGKYKIKFDATNLPSGVYFYQLKSDNNIATKKLILLK